MTGECFSLRPYQQEACEAIERSHEEGYTKLLVVIPTGGGKTIIFAMVASKRGRTLVLAHRDELLRQAADKIQRTTGIVAEIDKADEYASLKARVVVGSVQTLVRKRRRERFFEDHFDQVVIDEGHHAVSESYRTVIDYFCSAPSTKLLLVTATPHRGDRRSLGEVVDHLAYEVTLKELISQGWLVPIRVKTLPVSVGLDGLSKRAGDFSVDEAGARLAPYLIELADAVAEEIRDRKTVIFLPLVSLSETFCDLLRERGINAGWVAGESPNRREILDWFDRAPKGSALCNAMLLNEGWDQCDVDCVIPLRPTVIDSLYAQMVGRGTRLSPETGKDHCLVLDPLWISTKLRLSRPSRLIASSDEEADEIDKRLASIAAAKAAGGSAADEDDPDLMKAASDVAEARAQKLAKLARDNAHKKSRTFDPTDFCSAIGDEEGAAYEPMSAREGRPATPKQLASLEKAGFNTDAIKSFGHASRMIDNLFKRRDAGLATPKQLRLLLRFGIPDAAKVTFEEASKIISAKLGTGPAPASGRPAPKFCPVVTKTDATI